MKSGKSHHFGPEKWFRSKNTVNSDGRPILRPTNYLSTGFGGSRSPRPSGPFSGPLTNFLHSAAAMMDRFTGEQVLQQLWSVQYNYSDSDDEAKDVSEEEDDVEYNLARRCHFRQYIPSKPAKYGITFWVAWDARSSYAWKMQVYTGKPVGGAAERNQGMLVVLDVTEGLTPLAVFNNLIDVSSDNAFVIWREMNPA
ncbi:piggyBac transposable element-derived protein 4-like [Scomber scombrus]|uniref:PiggyBac transposable element-derived protein 4-like n=1 Tax=Scomber scombrus TaxID=13677 RepID=A0AAV1QLC7_SCOSC